MSSLYRYLGRKCIKVRVSSHKPSNKKGLVKGRYIDASLHVYCIEGHSHWYDLTKGQWIQGLAAHRRQERRIYVVTIEPELAEAVHDRWPRIMSG